MLGTKFFAIGGVILIVSGLLQVLVRPRDPREKGAARFINRSTIRAFVFALVGVFAILVGLGVIPVDMFGR